MFLDQGASANLNTCRHAGYVPPPVTRPQPRREGAVRPPRGQNCDLGHGCLEHTSRATWPLLARATVQSDVAFRGGRKGTAVHFVRPALQLGLRKVVGGTQLNVLRAAVPSQACCGHRGRCNRYRRPCKKFSSNSAAPYITYRQCRLQRSAQSTSSPAGR